MAVPQKGDLSIGEASDRSGIKVPTIRYYEQQGLLPAAPRSDGNRRLYSAADVQRLRFIRHTRDLGFAPAAIRTLLDLSDHPDQSCAEVDGLARLHLADVDTRIAQLTALRAELSRMVQACAGGPVSQCRVIESLADHQNCHSPHAGMT